MLDIERTKGFLFNPLVASMASRCIEILIEMVKGILENVRLDVKLHFIGLSLVA